MNVSDLVLIAIVHSSFALTFSNAQKFNILSFFTTRLSRSPLPIFPLGLGGSSSSIASFFHVSIKICTPPSTESVIVIECFYRRCVK